MIFWSRRLSLIAAIALSVLLLLSVLARSPAVAETSAPLACTDGTQASGALYRVCMPSIPWNDDLVLYAHGYVPDTETLAIPSEADGLALAFNFQGYAFATTSYSVNGLAVLPGSADLVDLVNIFTTTQSVPDHIYLIGLSEGGLITALSVEQHSDVFSGGVAGCGPVGDFQEQLDYIGDFRLVFDYFFPGLMLDSDPMTIPQSLIDGWDSHFTTTIEPVVADPTNSNKVDQLLRVTRAPYDLDNATDTIYDALRYNVIATNDARTKLGGVPFDNHDRVYRGSDDDEALNAALPRYTADVTVLTAIAEHQTTGVLTAPLVTLHTTLDPIVPYWHELDYRGKVIRSDNIAQHDHITIDRYGHCNFQATEVQAAFALLVDRVDNPPSYIPVSYVFLPVVIAH